MNTVNKQGDMMLYHITDSQIQEPVSEVLLVYRWR